MSDTFADIKISSQGGKNTTIEVVGNPSEPPEDYYTGEWILVGAKRAEKKKLKKHSIEIEKKKIDFQKMKEKKIEERKNAKLWYNEYSWQHRLITNCFTFKDGSSLILKYNLQQLMEEYETAKSNYRKNGVITKMMRIVTREIWLSIKDDVLDSSKIVEQKVEQEEEIEQAEQAEQVN